MESLDFVSKNENLRSKSHTKSKIDCQERFHKKSKTWKEFCNRKAESEKVWKLFNKMLKARDLHLAQDKRSGNVASFLL